MPTSEDRIVVLTLPTDQAWCRATNELQEATVEGPRVFPCNWCLRRWSDSRYFGRPGAPCDRCASDYPWLVDGEAR